ncbi:MAG: DUF1501 domain-containing protein [Acidobacteriia bacterium]|nr:DUF1501 domain-containing protein [Terriglobia bacterium]
MKGQHTFDRFQNRHPHSHKFFFERPHWNRRDFFKLLGAGVTGSVLAGPPAVGEITGKLNATPINKAKNTIFILLAGAISHTDTFDFKMSPDTPAALMKPETINGLAWPTGIMPKLAGSLPDICIARSVRSWALQHTLSQTWTQIGRSPAAALGDIAPNIGAIVAVEKDAERQPGQVFPTFLALNAGGAIGSGYLSSAYAPLKINPATSGMPDTTNPDGQPRLDLKYALMNALDAPLRTGSPYGREPEDYGKFYTAGRNMMFNPTVDQAFRFTAADSQRYGPSGFGNACLVAKQVLAARGGTRYIQINLGGWDHHQDIYEDLPPLAKQLDDGLSVLLSDLKSSGLLNETLVVVMGEFGRTTGRLTAQNGRDHYLQQFIAFAGAGIRGGRAIGATDPTGGASIEFGWSRDRDIRPEDCEATIYSAMGIDWTKIRYDDPFKRGFEYVPYAKEDIYGPINELWS